MPPTVARVVSPCICKRAWYPLCMRRDLLQTVALVVWLASCGSSVGAVQGDAAVPETGSAAPATGADAAVAETSAATTAPSCPSDGGVSSASSDGGACNLCLTRMVAGRGGHPGPAVALGSYCDTLRFCARDADAARDIEARVPSVACAAAPNGCGIASFTGSASGTYLCAWQSADANIGARVSVDTGVLDQLCTVTSVAPVPDIVECLVYD